MASNRLDFPVSSFQTQNFDCFLGATIMLMDRFAFAWKSRESNFACIPKLFCELSIKIVGPGRDLHPREVC